MQPLLDKYSMRLFELDTKPHFVLVMGGAGSGKNHYIRSTYPGHELIDVDVYKQHMDLSAAIKHVKTEMLDAFSARKNVAHPTTGSNLKGQQNKINLALQRDYSVTVVFIDTPVGIATQQVAQRVQSGGHSASNIAGSNAKARENFEILRNIPGVSAIVVKRQVS